MKADAKFPAQPALTFIRERGWTSRHHHRRFGIGERLYAQVLAGKDLDLDTADKVANVLVGHPMLLWPDEYMVEA